MTTARDVMELVRPDHQFTLARIVGTFLDHNSEVRLRCSCLWSASRLVHDRELDDGYSEVLTSEWVDRMRMDHLLDQVLDPEAVLELVGRAE